MRRHDTDWLALSFGGLYVVIAAVHIGTDGTGSSGDSLRWFIPATLLVLGVLGLIGATTRGRTPAVAPGGPYPSAPANPSTDTSSTDTPSTDTPSPETSSPETSIADEPDGVAHTSRLDDELTLRLDDDAQPGEQPGKPAADD